MAAFLISLLKVGSISFGGHASLVAVLQKELAEKKLLSDESVLEYFTIASILPGPVAVNVVACVGYQLYGWLGAVLSIAAILLPSVFMLSFFYFFATEFAFSVWLNKAVSGVLPVVSAIVLSAGYDMTVKQCKSFWQYILLFTIFVSLLFNHSIFWILIYFLLGGVAVFFFGSDNRININNSGLKMNPRQLIIALVFISAMMTSDAFLSSEVVKLLAVFSRLSVTLFGGGYVIIPILKEIFVEHFNWVTLAQFNQAVVFSQVTPGPILIVSTYVGFIRAGAAGAFFSTLGMFIPSAFLCIVVASSYGKLTKFPWFKSFLIGLRIAGIALMIYASFIILNPDSVSYTSWLVFFISFLCIRFNTLHYLVLILLGAILGIYL